MPEFHQLPSHTTESERFLRKMMKNDASSASSSLSYDRVEQWMIQHWDEWNEQALQRTLQNSKTPAKMPTLNHLTYLDFQHVYEPSDDTYLLLDAIQYELLLSSSFESPQSNSCSEASYDNVENNRYDHDNDTPKICLEIGSGSGVVSVYFRSCWLQQQQQQQQHEEDEEAEECMERSNQKRQRRRPFLLSYVTDINPVALQTTYRTFQEAARNQTNRRPDEEEQPPAQFDHHHAIENPSRIDHVEYVLCDIATPLLSRLRHQVSTIICNPPYVPTCDDDNDDAIGATPDLITAAYAGGRNGRRVVDRIVSQIIQLLHVPDGVAFLVTVDDNLPLDLAMNIYRQQQQPSTSTNRILLMKPLFRKRTKNEFLTIQKITYIDPGCCAT